MKKFLDILLLIFCLGTLINTSGLVIENLQLILFLIGWFILLLFTLYLMLSSKSFDPSTYIKKEEKKDPKIKIDTEIEKKLKDPKI